MHYVATYGGDIIGDAVTKADAIRICEESGLTVIPEDDGGKIDFYDAEDGPHVQGYESDGCGVWIVTCK